MARIDAIADLLDRPRPPSPSVPPRVATAADEPADPDTVLRDYVLAPYPPLAAVAGGLAAVNVLNESFAIAGVEVAGVALVARLRAALGRGRLVWGVKWNGVGLAWEFYVYDPGGERAEASPAAVLAGLSELVAVPRLPSRAIVHHMWSLAVDGAALTGGGAGTLTLYLAGADTPGASRSYTVLPDGELALANLYTFHDPRRDPRAIVARLAAGVHTGADPRGAAAVIAPGLERCRRLCVANKRHCDGLYFAGVDTDRTVQFLLAHRWPPALIGFLDHRRDRFAHLAWDLGLDAVAGPDGQVAITRTAVHASC